MDTGMNTFAFLRPPRLRGQAPLPCDECHRGEPERRAREESRRGKPERRAGEESRRGKPVHPKQTRQALKLKRVLYCTMLNCINIIQDNIILFNTLQISALHYCTLHDRTVFQFGVLCELHLMIFDSFTEFDATYPPFKSTSTRGTLPSTARATALISCCWERGRERSASD